MPHFVQTPSCNLLRDVMRYLLDVGPNSICQDSCKGRKATNGKCCKKHFLTPKEFGELQLGWRHWAGTVMLAEAGALTLPHFDKWGLGTHISCLEGEIGFAWLSQPTDEQLVSVLQKPDEVEGRWLFKVLRPGDALYMSPGTPHLVFRLPHGKQTLGLAGHVVRRCDFERWVQLLTLEAEKGEEHDETFADVMRGLATGMEHMVSKVAGEQGTTEQYGGKKQVTKIKKALENFKKLTTEQPVGLRLALSCPGQVKAIITQNGNAYVEGLGEVWAPIRDLWQSENGTSEREIKPRTKFQYTAGVPEEDLKLIDPMAYHLDYLTNIQGPANEERQLDLFHDYRTNLALYAKFQAYFRSSKVLILAIWGRGDPFFIPAGAEAYKKHSPDAVVKLLDAGHFARETKRWEVASEVKEFLGTVRL
ncbi:hypothetical protein LTR85_007556 [Meristemomyces frigidus]|nr:hypothetical protein LTR85_007556 [Meristemomyces frigidus]